MIPGDLSTLDTIGLALMCAGVGLLLLVCVHIASGGARPGREEWRAAVRRHRWQPQHVDQPRHVEPAPAGLPLEDSLTLLALAAQMREWPAQDRWQSADLVRRYVPGRHTAEQAVA